MGTYTGTYLSDSDGYAQVSVYGERLSLNWNGEEHLLTCHAPGHYIVTLGTGSFFGLGFVRNAGDPVRYLVLGEALFERATVASSISTDRWERYVGAYRLKQPPITVRVEAGVLWMHSAFYGEEARCVPLSHYEFACKWGRFSFQVSPTGDVQGILWGGERFIPRH